MSKWPRRSWNCPGPGRRLRGGDDMVDDTRPGDGRIPAELRSAVDRLLRDGTMIVGDARAWSTEVRRIMGEAEVHLRGLSDDDYREAASGARLDQLYRLVDDFLALDPYAR